MFFSRKYKIVLVATSVLLLCFLFFHFYKKPKNVAINDNVLFREKICKNINADVVYEFYDNLARVGFNKNRNQKARMFPISGLVEWEWNFVDKEEKILSESNFDLANDFHQGFAVVRKDNDYFFIDTAGKNRFGEVYRSAEDFSDGFALVNKGDKYFFLNVDGVNEFGEFYDDARSFSSGIAVVKQEVNYFLLTTDGERRILFNDAEPFGSLDGFSDGAFLFHYSLNDDRFYFFVDSEGKKMFNKTFRRASVFNNGLAAVCGSRSPLMLLSKKLARACYFIDKNGDKVSKKYGSVSDLNDGVAVVTKWGKYFFINKDGKKILNEIFDFADSFFDGVAYVIKDEKGFFIKQNGERFCQ